MSYNNLTSEQTEQMLIITNLKEMYESNNTLLTNVTHITNTNINNDNITNLVNNLIRINDEIKQSIMVLLNVNVNNRQQNNYRNRPNYHNNRQNYLNNPTISNLFHTFFDPIEIFPTPSQIESATRVARFGDITRPLNSTCPISLENFNDNDQVQMIRHCNHIFNNTGLISWFRSSCVCPVCRYDIRNHIPNNNNSDNISGLSTNVGLSSNILPSSLTNLERSSNSVTPPSIYVTNNDLTRTYASDISGNNLLHFFFHT
jgi:hypothetical protein